MRLVRNRRKLDKNELSLSNWKLSYMIFHRIVCLLHIWNLGSMIFHSIKSRRAEQLMNMLRRKKNNALMFTRKINHMIQLNAAFSVTTFSLFLFLPYTYHTLYPNSSIREYLDAENYTSCNNWRTSTVREEENRERENQICCCCCWSHSWMAERSAWFGISSQFGSFKFVIGDVSWPLSIQPFIASAS